MARAKFCFIEIEGGDETIAHAARIFANMLDAESAAPPAPAISPAPAPAAIEPPAASHLEHKPSSSAPAARGNGATVAKQTGVPPAKRKERLIIVDERPGELFTIDRAANLTGVKRKTLQIALTPFAQRKGYSVGGFHVHPAPIAGDGVLVKPGLGDARPRFSGTAAPINPRVNGGAAPITHAKLPNDHTDIDDF